MAEYETEEEQVEALKNWWKENGTAVLAGAFLGVAALGGWRFWEHHQETQATEASDLFATVQESLTNGDEQALHSQAEVLQTKYDSTPYAALATLHLAKSQVEKGEIATAIESLRWVIENSKQDTVQSIARIRLARTFIADNKLEEASAAINHAIPEAYASLVNEVRGDIFVAKGEMDQAKQAYDQALESSAASGVEYLQMKRNNLGS